MEHNIHFVTAEFSALNAIEAQCTKDKIYTSFSSDVEQCISEFERAKDWTDLVSCLQQQQKILEGSKYQTKYKFLPQGQIAGLTRVLAQSMQFGQPPGVHSKSLRVYRVLLGRIGVEFFIRDMAFFSNGLQPAQQYGTEGIRLELLVVIDQFYLPLGSKLASVSVSLLCGLLSCIEDPSSNQCRETLVLLNRQRESLGSVLYLTSCMEVQQACPSQVVPILEHLLTLRNVYTVSTNVYNGDIPALEYPQETQQLVTDALLSALTSKDDLRVKTALAVMPDFLPLTSLHVPRDAGTHPMVLSEHSFQRLLQTVFPLIVSADVGIQRRAVIWFSQAVGEDRQLSSFASNLVLAMFRDIIDTVMQTAVTAKQFQSPDWILPRFENKEEWLQYDQLPLFFLLIPQTISMTDAEKVVEFQMQVTSVVSKLASFLTCLSTQTVFDNSSILQQCEVTLTVLEQVLSALQSLSTSLLKIAQDAFVLQSRITEPSTVISTQRGDKDSIDQFFAGIDTPDCLAVVNYVEGRSFLHYKSEHGDVSIPDQIQAYLVTDATSSVSRDTKRAIRSILPSSIVFLTCQPHVFTEMKEAHSTLARSINTALQVVHERYTVLSTLKVDTYNTVMSSILKKDIYALQNMLHDTQCVLPHMALLAYVHSKTEAHKTVAMEDVPTVNKFLQQTGISASLLLAVLSIRESSMWKDVFQAHITNTTVIESAEHALILFYCTLAYGIGQDVLQQKLTAYPKILSASIKECAPSDAALQEEFFFKTVSQLGLIDAQLAPVLARVALQRNWIHHLRPTADILTALVACLGTSMCVPFISVPNAPDNVFFVYVSGLEADTKVVQELEAIVYLLNNKEWVNVLRNTFLEHANINSWHVSSVPTDGFLVPACLHTIEDFFLVCVVALSASQCYSSRILTRHLPVRLVIDPLRSSILSTLPLPPPVPVVQTKLLSSSSLLSISKELPLFSPSVCALHTQSTVTVADILSLRLLLAKQACFDTMLHTFILCHKDVSPFFPLSSIANTLRLSVASETYASVDMSCGYERHLGSTVYAYESLLRAKNVQVSLVCTLFPLSMPYTHVILPLLLDYAVKQAIFPLIVHVLQFSIVLTGEMGTSCCGTHTPTPLSTVPHPADVDPSFLKVLTGTVRTRADVGLATGSGGFYEPGLLEHAPVCPCKKLLETPKTALAGALTSLWRKDHQSDAFLVPASLPWEPSSLNNASNTSNIVSSAAAQYLADSPPAVIAQLEIDTRQTDITLASCALYASASLLTAASKLPFNPSTVRSLLYTHTPSSQNSGLLGWLSNNNAPVSPVVTLCWCQKRAPTSTSNELLRAAILALVPPILPYIVEEECLKSVFSQLLRMYPVRLMTDIAKLWPINETFSLKQRRILLFLCHTLGPLHVLKFALQAIQTLHNATEEYTVLPLTLVGANIGLSMNSQGGLYSHSDGPIKGQSSVTDTILPSYAQPGTGSIHLASMDVPVQYPALFAIMTYTLLLLDVICAHHAFPTASCPVPATHPLLLLNSEQVQHLCADVGASCWGMLCLLSFIPNLTKTLVTMSMNGKKPSPMTLYVYSQTILLASICHQALSKRLVTTTPSFLPLKLLYQRIKEEQHEERTSTCWPACASSSVCYSKDCCHGILHSSTLRIQRQKPGFDGDMEKAGAQMLQCSEVVLTPTTIGVLKPQLLHVLHTVLTIIAPYTTQFLPWITGDTCQLIDLLPCTSFLTPPRSNSDKEVYNQAQPCYTSLTLVLLRTFTRVFSVLMENYIIPCASQHYAHTLLTKPIASVTKTVTLALGMAGTSNTVFDITADVDPYFSSLNADANNFTAQNVTKQALPPVLQCLTTLPGYPATALYKEQVSAHWLELCHFISAMHLPSFYAVVGSAMKPFLSHFLKTGGSTHIPLPAQKMLISPISTTLSNALPATPVYSLQGYYHADRDHDKKLLNNTHVFQGRITTPNLDATQMGVFCRSLGLQVYSAKEQSPVTGVGILERVVQAFKVPITCTTDISNAVIVLHMEGMLQFRVIMLRMPKNRWISVLPTLISTIITHFHLLVGVTLQDTISQIHGNYSPSMRSHSKEFQKLILQDIHVLLECAVHNREAILPLQEFFASAHVKYVQHPLFDKTSDLTQVDNTIINVYKQVYTQEQLEWNGSQPNLAVLFIAIQDAVDIHPIHPSNIDTTNTYTLLKHPEMYNDKWSSQITLEWDNCINNPLATLLHQYLHNKQSPAHTIDDLVLQAFTEI